MQTTETVDSLASKQLLPVTSKSCNGTTPTVDQQQQRQESTIGGSFFDHKNLQPSTINSLAFPMGTPLEIMSSLELFFLANSFHAQIVNYLANHHNHQQQQLHRSLDVQQLQSPTKPDVSPSKPQQSATPKTANVSFNICNLLMRNEPSTNTMGDSSADVNSGSILTEARRKKYGFQTGTTGVTTGYTMTGLIKSDGRSRSRTLDGIAHCVEHRHHCGQCGKTYATSSNLSRHRQTHRPLNGDSARKCTHCGKVYVSMPALSMHLLTHKLEHKCTVCSKSFSRPWLLQGHMRAHTGQKPYGCAHCGKAFADRSNLRAHMQTHSDSKKHSCRRCGRMFALKSYLNKHLESTCPGRSPLLE